MTCESRSAGFVVVMGAVPRQNSIRMELNPRVTLLHPQAILGETGMLRFGKLLIRKLPRERGVLTRDRHGTPPVWVAASAHVGDRYRHRPRSYAALGDSAAEASHG